MSRKDLMVIASHTVVLEGQIQHEGEIELTRSCRISTTYLCIPHCYNIYVTLK